MTALQSPSHSFWKQTLAKQQLGLTTIVILKTEYDSFPHFKFDDVAPFAAVLLSITMSSSLSPEHVVHQPIFDWM
jgi:hypothetical protein